MISQWCALRAPPTTAVSTEHRTDWNQATVFGPGTVIAVINRDDHMLTK